MAPVRQRILAALGGLGIGVLLALQFLPHGAERTNPPVVAEPDWPDPAAREVFETSCAACHSNRTDWPWYSNVAPMSWLVIDDVVEGRDEFNVSRWDEDADEADDAVEEVLEGSMPPRRYVLAHPSARLTAEEQQVLVEALRAMAE